MACIAAGDTAAVEPIVDRYHGPLLGYVYRLTSGDRQLTEDLVQETFIRIIRQRTYRVNMPFRPWLYRVASNVVQDHFRSAGRTNVQSDRGQIAIEADREPGPEGLLLSHDLGLQIATAIGQLSDDIKPAVLLRYYQGLTIQEISDALQIPVGTVKSRLFVGTHRLRALLQESRS